MNDIKKDTSSNKKVQENSLIFEPLTPNKHIDKHKCFDFLKMAIEHEDITNIALTGPYGSGKSSIIQSFEHKYKNDKNINFQFLNISLASFKEETSSNNDSGNKIITSVDMQKIEKSILQQMFYKVDSKVIPNSRFKRIKTIKNPIKKTIGFAIWLLSFFSIFFYDKTIKPIIEQNTFIVKDFNIYDYILHPLFSLIVFAGIGYLIYELIKQISGIKLDKISLKEPEISLGNGTEISILNKHLDEIIYFFEQTDYNVVVIEDLDRFKSTEIFTKLRELNKLINDCEQVKNKPINFIYAIKDNMFKDKDRTKFFDYIIPIIPIVNTSNSYNEIKLKLKKAKLLEIKENNNSKMKKIEDQFIYDIALYFNDMRLLTNIFNEFIQYKEYLFQDKNQSLNLNNLLAIVIYKNMNPCDFAKLHEDDGVIYDIFVDKKIFVNSINEELKSKVEEVNNAIENAKVEKLQNTRELRMIYIAKFFEKTSFHQIKLGNRVFNFSQLLEEDNFNRLMNTSPILYNVQGNPRNFVESTIVFQSLENEINENLTYKQREELLKNNLELDFAKKKKELESYKHQIGTNNTYSIVELSKYYDINKVLNFKEDLFPNKNAMEVTSYLIRYGYIDEMYDRYISYFKEGKETKEDLEFLHNILNDGESLGFEYKLTAVKEIVKRLRFNDYSKQIILNNDLLDYLLINENKHSTKLTELLKVIVNEDVKSMNFLYSYIKRKKNLVDLIKVSSKIKFNFLKFIYSTISLVEAEKNEFEILIIESLSLDELLNYNDKNELKWYLANRLNFINLEKNHSLTNKITQLIKSLDVKFDDMSRIIKDGYYYKYIYDNNMYIINLNMLKEFIGKEFSEELNTQNYTTLLKSDKQKLIDYIHVNIGEYINNIFLQLTKNKKEDKNSINKLLAIEELELDTKKSILDKQPNFIFENLDDINQDELKYFTYIHKKIYPYWNEFVAVYESELEEYDGVTAEQKQKDLISLLNDDSFCDNLTNGLSIGLDGSEALEDFLFSGVLCDYSFDKLSGCLTIEYEELPNRVRNLNASNIELLIERKIILLSYYNVDILKEIDYNLHINLVEKNIELFLEELKTDDSSFNNLDLEDIRFLINKGNISDKEKLVILKYQDDFDLLDTTTQDTLIEIINQMDTSDNSSKDNAINVLINSNLEIGSKLKLVSKLSDTFMNDNVKNILNGLGNEYDTLLDKGSITAINYSPLNMDLLKRLKKNKFIKGHKRVKELIEIQINDEVNT